jgi:tRNA1(Val) A37 N6-methylase TrmN6
LKPFTIEYSQPEEYRFSLDSVEAPWRIAQHLLDGGREAIAVLDLCAGVGVMGIELAAFLPQDFSIDFVEVQSVYRSFFETNFERLRERDRANGVSRQLRARWLEMNYEGLLSEEFHERYDLILSNPPYFRAEQGKLSPSEFKNRCRFFLDSTPEKLWDAIAHALRPGGEAFVLVRPLDDHDQDPVGEIRQRLKYSARVENEDDIRGTALVRISK